MELYLISAEIFFQEEIPLLSAMFKSGSFTFHLRKPNATKEQIINFLHELPDAYRKYVVLHQYYELARQFSLKGIHLKAETKEITLDELQEFTESKKTKFTISISLHELPELENVAPFIEYAFISPVFDSISKRGYISRIDLAKAQLELEMLRNKGKNLKIIALGGILPAHLRILKESGFHGAAVLGAVWESNDPLNSWIEFKNLAIQL